MTAACVVSWVSHGAPGRLLLGWGSRWLPAEPDVQLSPHQALHASLSGGRTGARDEVAGAEVLGPLDGLWGKAGLLSWVPIILSA
jgi:hypothetical protein